MTPAERQRRRPDRITSDEAKLDSDNQYVAITLMADATVERLKQPYKGKIDALIIDMARRAAGAWKEFADILDQRAVEACQRVRRGS